MPTDDEDTTPLLDPTPPDVRVELIQQQPLIMTLDGVLSEQECERIIAWSEEEIGYDRELLSRQNTPMQHERIRSNARAIHDDPGRQIRREISDQRRQSIRREKDATGERQRQIQDVRDRQGRLWSRPIAERDAQKTDGDASCEEGHDQPGPSIGRE